MPEPTSDAWAHIRYEYEHTSRTVEDICADHGISSATLRDRMRRWRWTRRRPPIPRDGPPAVAMAGYADALHPPLEGEGIGGLRPPSLCERTPMQSVGYGASSPEFVRARCEPGWGDFQTQTDHPTPTVFAGAQTVDPPPPGEGDDAALTQSMPAKPAADSASIAQRLQSAAGRVLPAIEAIIARLAAGPRHPREMEQAGRALGALTRTLRELNALLSQQKLQAPQPYDDMPEDLDAFREALAQRIDALLAEPPDDAANGGET